MGGEELRLVEVDPLGDSVSECAWDELFTSQAGIANPFCAREWVTGWYRTFTRSDERKLIQVWRGDQLVGVAPFFQSTIGPRRVGAARRLQLVGSGQGGALLELPQILSAPGQERAVHRAVVSETMASLSDGSRRTRLDWAELAIPSTAGWFEPEWVVTSDPVSFYRQHLSRACVVLHLAGTWEATRGTLKRNVKESLRRSHNRLVKSGRDWSVAARGRDIDPSAVDRFFALHQQRAQQATGVRHADAFAERRRRDLLRELLPTLGRKRMASLYELRLDEAVVAVQLVLHAPGVSYIHSSGFQADVWEFGPVTHLQGEAIKDAVERGDTWINFSPGPNVAKLRWSEQIDVHTDFAYGRGTRPLRWRYELFAAGQSLAQVNHAVSVACRDRDL